MSPILLKFAMIALKTFLHKKIFDTFLQRREFGPENSRKLCFFKILDNFLTFTPSTPDKRRDEPKIIQGKVYETTAGKTDPFRDLPPQDAAPLSTISSFGTSDPTTPHIQTHFSTQRRVSRNSTSRGCETLLAASISPCWFFDLWVKTPTWPAFFPPAYVLG